MVVTESEKAGKPGQRKSREFVSFSKCAVFYIGSLLLIKSDIFTFYNSWFFFETLLTLISNFIKNLF